MGQAVTGAAAAEVAVAVTAAVPEEVRAAVEAEEP